MSGFEPVAIVGRSCVLPGAATPEALFEATMAGRCLLSATPRDHWRGVDPAALLASDQSALNPQEVSQVDATALEIKNCNQALKNAGDWMGLPFDLEWVDMLDKLPRLNALYRASLLDPSQVPLVILDSQAASAPQNTPTGASR